jgi:hypothetical protein
MLRRLVLAIWFSLASSVALANGSNFSGSTFCLYDILLESHAMVSHCGSHLDSASERRYLQMLSAVRKNIIENTQKPGKSAADIEKEIIQFETKRQDEYRGKGRAICKSSAFNDARGMLTSFTAPKNSLMILEHLKGLKRNPYEGDCL